VVYISSKNNSTVFTNENTHFPKLAQLERTVDDVGCCARSLILLFRYSLLHHDAKSSEKFHSSILLRSDCASIFYNLYGEHYTNRGLNSTYQHLWYMLYPLSYLADYILFANKSILHESWCTRNQKKFHLSFWHRENVHISEKQDVNFAKSFEKRVFFLILKWLVVILIASTTKKTNHSEVTWIKMIQNFKCFKAFCSETKRGKQVVT